MFPKHDMKANHCLEQKYLTERRFFFAFTHSLVENVLCTFVRWLAQLYIWGAPIKISR